MKNVSNVLQYLPTRIFVIAVAVIIAAVTTFAVAANSDAPVLTWTGNDTAGGDQVQFNAFSNNPIWGDERDFVRGSVDGRDSTKTDPVDDVRDGDVVDVVVYVHNVIDSKYNASGDGIARNTRVAVTLPGGNAMSQDISATVSADNTPYGSVTDTVTLNSDGHFELEPIAGSGRINGNYDSDTPIDVNALVNGGVNIGDTPGCFEYVKYVSFKVKVKAPRATIQKKVRHEGTGPGNWKELIDTKIGDKVEWAVEFTNAGSTSLNNVKIVDQIPAGHKVVPGTVELVNPETPSFIYPDSAIQANGKQINVDIGSYAAGVNAILYYFTEVVDDAQFECGAIKVQNVAYATPDGYGAVSDDAYTVIDTERTCQPDPVISCNALNASVANITVGQSVNFTVDVTAENGATADSFTLLVNGTDINKGGNVDGAINYTFATPGTYTVQAVVSFTVKGETKTVKSANCATTITVEEEPETPVYSCDALTASKLSITAGDTVDFTTATTAAGGAVLDNLVYSFGDGTGMSGASNISHTYEEAGNYTATVTAYFIVDGNEKSVTSNACKVTINVQEEIVPVFSCDALTIIPGSATTDEEVTFTVNASASNGAVIEGYVLDFGDDSVVPYYTNENQLTAKHTYTTGGNYEVMAVVMVSVNDGDPLSVTGANCMKNINVEVVETPYAICKGVIAEQIGQSLSVRIVATIVARNGATANAATFTFGDDETFTGNNFVDAGDNMQTITVDHEYAKAGTKEINVSIVFDIEGDDQRTVTCNAEADIVTPVIGKGVTTLPNTGAGSALFAIFGISIVGTLVKNLITSKRKALVNQIG